MVPIITSNSASAQTVLSHKPKALINLINRKKMNPEQVDMETEQAPVADQENLQEVDDVGEFVDMNDVEEVQVDDENAPMDDDDDDDAVAVAAAPSEPIVDMSKAQVTTAHTDAVYAVASFLEPADGSLTVVTGGGDDKAFLHKLGGQGGNQSQMLSFQHTDTVSSVALNTAFVSDDLSKTPKFAAAAGYDGNICIYNPDTAALLHKLEGPSDVECLAFHNKGGSVLLAGSGDATLWMFHMSVSNSKCLQVFVGHEAAVTGCTFSKDGRWALSGSSDGTVRIWAPKTGLNKHTFRFVRQGQEAAPITCMDTGGAENQLILAGAEDGTAHVCHIATKKVVTSLRHYEIPLELQNSENDQEEMELPMSVEAVGFSTSNPNWVATGGVDGVLKIWDLSIGDGTCRHQCKTGMEHEGITRLKWHPSLPVVFTSTSRGRIQVWDARSGSLLQTLTGHADSINDLDFQFTAAGVAVITTVSDDKSLRVFESNVPALLNQQS